MRFIKLGFFCRGKHMTNEEVKHLTRTQLLALLVKFSGENESLRAERDRLKAEIESLKEMNGRIKTIEEISLRILASVEEKQN